MQAYVHRYALPFRVYPPGSGDHFAAGDNDPIPVGLGANDRWPGTIPRSLLAGAPIHRCRLCCRLQLPWRHLATPLAGHPRSTLASISERAAPGQRADGMG